MHHRGRGRGIYLGNKELKRQKHPHMEVQDHQKDQYSYPQFLLGYNSYNYHPVPWSLHLELVLTPTSSTPRMQGLVLKSHVSSKGHLSLVGF